MSAVLRQWFPAKDLAGLPGLPGTERSINRRAAEEKWVSQPRKGQGGGREYFLESLPPEARAELARRLSTPEAREGRAHARLAKASMQLTEDDQHNARVDSLAKLGTATGWVRTYIDARMTVLSTFALYHKLHGGTVTTARATFELEYNAGRIDIADEVRKVVPTVAAKTLERWSQRLKKEGISALAPKYGNRKNKCLIATQPPIHDLVIGMLTQFPHIHVSHIMQGLRARFAGTDLQLPANRTVQDFIKSWKEKNPQLLMAVTNPDQWRSTYMSAAGNASAHVMRLNQEWQTDSTKGDVMLADGTRHAVIGVIDVYSRRLKLHVARQSRATAIASVMRRAMQDWGVPESIKSDNGADYVSSHLKRIYAALNIEHVICPPFSPEKKPFIERALGTAMHDIVELLPGFIGHNVAQRKDIEARRSFAQRLMQGETVELRCDQEQLQKILDDWCELYHEREHGGLEGSTPNSRVLGQRVRRIDDERALDVLLQPVAGNSKGGWYVIGKKGVRIERGTYNHASLGGLEGNRVQAYQDESDWGYVYLYNEVGDFICKAFDPERLGIEHTEVANARKARQVRIVGEGKATLRAAQKRARTQDIVPDILAHRAALASNVVSLNISDRHTTPALEQAALAASNTVPQADIDEAAIDRLQAELSAPEQARDTHTVVMQMQSGEGRWAYANILLDRVKRGEQVVARDWQWAQSYIASPEYKSLNETAEDFGMSPAEVLKDLGVAG